MKRRNVRIIVLSLILAVFMIISVACGSNTGANNPASSQDSSAASTTAPASTAAAADPFGKYTPPIDVTIVHSTIDSDVKYPEGETATDNAWTRLYADQLGINLKVQWAGPSEQSGQKINLLIASNALADIMTVDSNTFQQLYNANKLQDLKSVYDQYATQDIKEQLSANQGLAMQSATIGGKLYAIPTFLDPQEDAFMLWVREDWRTKLGLPEPKTIDDMLAIADAFTTQDPDGDGKANTPGLGMTNDLWAHAAPFFNAFGAYPGFSQLMDYPHQWVKDSSGKLVVGMEAPEMKTALLKLQELYKKGDIDKEYALINYDKLPQQIADGKVGMIYGVWWYPLWPLQMNRDKDPNAEWKAYPMPSATGAPAKMAISGLSLRRYNVVTTNMKNPEAAIKLANLTYEKCYGTTADPETYVNKADAAKGASMWKYSAMFIEMAAKNQKKYIAINDAFTSNDTSRLTTEQKAAYDSVVKFNNGDDKNWGSAKVWGKDGAFSILNYYNSNDLYNYDGFFGAPTKTMTEKGPVIMKQLYEVVNKVIMGGDISEWDSFIRQWHTNGGDEMTQEVNDWYDSIK